LIWLDDGRSAKTDSQGRFKLSHVLPGAHTIEIAPTSLSADLSPDKFSADVNVKAGKTSQVDFTIRHVAQILGSVKVLPDALGQVDPTAGIGITITAGQNYATTTDQDGHFILGDIPAGTYSVALNKGTIPPDFSVDGPDSFTVTVVPDQPSPVVQFTIKPSHTNIEFVDNVPESKPAPVVAPKASPAKPAASAAPVRAEAKSTTPSAGIAHIQKNPVQQKSSAQPLPEARSASAPAAAKSIASSTAKRPANAAKIVRARSRPQALAARHGMGRRCVGCAASCHGCRHCRCPHCGCSHGRCTCAMRSRHIRRHHLRRRVVVPGRAIHRIKLARYSHPHRLKAGRKHRSRLCRCACRITAFPHPRTRLSASR